MKNGLRPLPFMVAGGEEMRLVQRLVKAVERRQLAARIGVYGQIA